MMGLEDLPEDVLLHVAAHFNIQDVLSLKQTCRALHAFGSADYLWHKLIERADLPLDVPVDTPTSQLSSDDLQRLAIRAIRLQLNWRRPKTKISRTTSLSPTNDVLFELMQFVPGGRWLLVVHGVLRRFEHRSYTRVCLWYLADISHPRCAVRFEMTGKHRGSAVTMRDEDSLATLVVALNDGEKDFIEVRSVLIDPALNALDTISPSPPVVVSRRIDIPPLPVDARATALIEAVSVWEDHLVATVAIIAPDQDITSRILVADTNAGPASWMEAGPHQAIALPQARLQGNRMLVFGYGRRDFMVQIYELPPAFAAGLAQRTSPDAVEWGDLVLQHQHPLANNLMDTVHIPPVSSTHLTIMVFNEADMNQPSAQVVRFPLRDQKAAVTSSRVPLPLDTSIRSVGIGTTGRRAVWMEHNLDSTRSRLMKLELGGTAEEKPELHYGVLLPPDPPLPFSTDACHSLAFDEATCRLCLGLWDGSLHVVDF